MFKQCALLLVFSILGIWFQEQLVYCLDGLIAVHNFLARQIHLVFTNDFPGRLIQDTISLVILPFLGAGIVALLFWFARRRVMPHTMTLVWVLWLVLFVTMLAQSHVAKMHGQWSGTPSGGILACSLT